MARGNAAGSGSRQGTKNLARKHHPDPWPEALWLTCRLPKRRRGWSKRGATWKSRALLRSGIAYVPQGNRVFTDLTVHENLEMGGTTLPTKQAVSEGMERVFALFPALKERLKQRAGTLSGGEKQMLALGNALILSPKLLLLDEPSLGLAPPLVSQALGRIQQISKDAGMSVVIVEQKVREVLKIARRVYVLRTGQISFAGPADALGDDAKLREVYL